MKERFLVGDGFAGSQARVAVLTFDVEEWFHILDNATGSRPETWDGLESRIHANMERILNALSQTRHGATFFCVGWVARKYPEILRSILSCGYDIGSHSDMHRLAYVQGRDAFRADVRLSIDILEQLSGRRVRSVRAPGFSITRANAWAFGVLAECGVEIDSSVFPARHGHGGFPGFPAGTPVRVRAGTAIVKEFPITVRSVLGTRVVFSGGGYFRLAPYWLIRVLSRRSAYLMTYFHPRDFDAAQPLLGGLSPRRRFKSYYGLSGALGKFQRYLREFSFVDIETAARRTDWERAPLVDAG